MAIIGSFRYLCLCVFFALTFFHYAEAQKNALTLESVRAQISEYIQGGTVGTLDTRNIDTQGLSQCSLACQFLDFTKPGTVSFEGNTNKSSVYNYEQSRYWSAQQELTLPKCRYSPTSALDVSLAVLVLQVTQCQFAVKSGGHAAFAGASNIEAGVTIDLLYLNQITTSADRTQTSVGPGNRWVDVYSKLSPMNLTVIGGRVADIGVGGLTLGGGMSFFSARYGWACDNINNYEVVFADGSIRNVNPKSYPDLYFALRGGGNNFGIVTRFDMATYAQGDMWGGSLAYIFNEATATSMNQALSDLNINSASDPYGQVILAYAFAPSVGYIIAADLQYGKPVANPPILQEFTDVPGAVASTLKIRSLVDLTVEFNASNPGGYRQTYWTLMTKNSASLMGDMVSIWQEETDKVTDAANITASMSIQPLPVSMTSHFSKNGGNALGISASDGPLILLNVVVSWFSPTDDERILASARNTVSRINATAYAQGLGFPFLYQNYAAKEQDVFDSYGKANLLKLKSVSRKYDPEGVWWKLQPGYFKIF